MAGPSQFFRRFRLPDVVVAQAEISTLERDLTAGKLGHNEECLLRMRLGFLLTPLDREAEAINHLEIALGLTRESNDRAREIEVLLYLATATQYAGDRDKAMLLFDEAFALAGQLGLDEQVHFLWHHRGRCEVEMGRLDDARRSFEMALKLREALGNARMIESTRAALLDLRAL